MTTIRRDLGESFNAFLLKKLMNDGAADFDLTLASRDSIARDAGQLIDVVKIDIVELVDFVLDVTGDRDVDEKKWMPAPTVERFLDRRFVNDGMRRAGR